MEDAQNSKLSLFITLVICVAIIHFPFLNKAFRIDDTLFYYTAKQILANPLKPYSFHINWLGDTQRAYDFFSNPPGISYYIAFIIFIFGTNEKVIHLFYILFSLLSVFSMYFLTKRFTKFPLASTLLLVFSPIYMIMAHTIMPDLPLVALFLLSVTLFVYGSDQQNILFLVLSGIAASIVILIRYNGLAIIPILSFYYLLHFNAKKKWNILVLLIPTVVFVAWNLFTKSVYGESHFFFHLAFQRYLEKMSLKGTMKHLLPHLSYLGGGTIFPLFFLIPVLSKNKTDKILFVILGIYIFSAAFHFGKGFNYDYVHTLLSCIFIFCIVYFLLIFLKKVAAILFLKKRILTDEVFLLVWIFGMLAMQNSGIQSAAKYMIVIIPPLIILLMKDSYWTKHRGIYCNIMICAMLFFTVVMGFITAAADYESANVNRKIADYCEKNIKIGKNNNIWFLGHWGFQYYMEKKGFRAYEQYSNEPQKGDFLVRSSLAWPQRMSRRLKVRFVDRVRYSGTIPIRIMHNEPGKHANFYAFLNYDIGYGILPFSISSSHIDEFTIYQIIDK